jgi:transposase-like protein
MTCPHCRAAVLVEIGVLVAGNRFTMHSCPSCETRWWDLDGGKVALDQVLTTAASV